MMQDFQSRHPGRAVLWRRTSRAGIPGVPKTLLPLTAEPKHALVWLQDLKSRYVGRRVPVTIREVSRADRKITLNMVDASQILAYRSIKVWPCLAFLCGIAKAHACPAGHRISPGSLYTSVMDPGCVCPGLQSW